MFFAIINPHTHVECDPIKVETKKVYKLFQSTHSYRVRRNEKDCRRRLGDFNPRTHIECDCDFRPNYNIF